MKKNDSIPPCQSFLTVKTVKHLPGTTWMIDCGKGKGHEGEHLAANGTTWPPV
ncbi:hypothetical protein [Rhodococcus jostii]|uniref:hypothetical protein n=1 Tax=Rhodococcus jostii TaxID=132919 RepID=UPI0036338003